MNIKQESQNTIDDKITEYIYDDNYIRFLLHQIDNIDESLSLYEQYVKSHQPKKKGKPSKLESLILGFIFARKDEIDLSQDHHDDLNLIAELIMLQHSEGGYCE